MFDFDFRHGFSERTPTFSVERSEELAMTRLAFSIEFWQKWGHHSPSEIYNADETCIYLDTPPNRMWAERGGSARIDRSQKHSARMTALLTVRSDGKKLPIVFIIKGRPDGTIEEREIPTYPPGHHYFVQENAWMDESVWYKYVVDCLRFEIDSPSVILLDNFDAHVSDQGIRVMAEEACVQVCPLPPNSTSVVQPLDVGVMGPFKARLRSLWLQELETPTTAAAKRLTTIKRAIKAWEWMPSATVISSFDKAIPKEQYAEV